jgi:hypothetical protein
LLDDLRKTTKTLARSKLCPIPDLNSGPENINHVRHALNCEVVWQYAAAPPHDTYRRNFMDCFNISVTLARLKCKLPDDGLGPKYVGAILI